MSIKIIKDTNNRPVDCVKSEKHGVKGCRHNFTSVCNGCQIFTGHGGKSNLFQGI